jgi:hypothetical protein
MGYLQSVDKDKVLETFSPDRGDARLRRTEGALRKQRLYFSLVALTFCLNIFCQEKEPKNRYTRIVAGPMLSFYQNNQFHTANSRPRYAFFIGIYEDIKMHKNFSFMPGVEYAYHGLTFNSYYLAPGYQFLYDGHFDYNYQLTFQEARLNLLFKQVIGVETRNVVTGYTSCGYILRYLFSSKMVVNSNLTGAELFNGQPHVEFEHPLFQKNMASAVKFVAGVQRNFFKTHRAFFFECAFTFSLSRFYISENFTPSSLYINGSFLQLGLGFKF